jgi:hypothetical protein
MTHTRNGTERNNLEVGYLEAKNSCRGRYGADSAIFQV